MKLKITALTVAATLALSAVSGQAATYTSYYAFGDSLSDDGKLGLPEPYFEGRFSSGPVWTDLIAENFGNLGLNTANLALGGATAGDDNVFSNGDPSDEEYPAALYPFATFNAQIDTFTPLGLSPLTGDNPLTTVLFGANDIFQGGSPVDAANAVADGIQRLVELAPKFNSFLVSTLPELGDPPGAGGLTLAGIFNSVLGDRLSIYDSTDVTIINLDQNLFFSQLFPRLPDLGVTNLTEPCLVEPTATTSGSDCTIIGFEEDGTPIRDLSIADSYFLIDSVHFSGPIQQALGEFAIDLLGDDLPAPVPLPAGLPMVIAGLGAFGLLRARKSIKAI